MSPLTIHDLQQLPSPLFIAGPAYSGKSKLTIRAFAESSKKSITTIGTANISDPMFALHLSKLQEARPTDWKQVSAPEELAVAIHSASKNSDLIIIDSINQWLGNLFSSAEQKYDELQFYQRLQTESKALLDAIEQAKNHCSITMISSEQGAGPTPAAPFARLYRQALGRLNEKLAETSQSVVSVQWGIPTLLR